MAVLVLKKYKPIIIGVTGSVGKSSTKEAIALALKQKYFVRKNEENYNNEVGVPLTVIGEKSGKKSIVAWLRILIRWCRLMLVREKYPEVLVLELGIDRPGDMKYLLGFLPVQIGVMTNVSSSHLEFFKNIGSIAKEKGRLISALPSSGVAVLCADDARIMKYAQKTKAKVVSFGKEQPADIAYEHFSLQDLGSEVSGCAFKIVYEGKSVPVKLPYVVAEHHIMAVLSAIAVAVSLKLNLVDAIMALESFHSLPGRMRLLSGKNMSWILDDTYNASPTSTKAALRTVSAIPCKRRIAILGDMLELGVESDSSHGEVADWIMENTIDQVVLVGKRMLLASDALERKGFSKENITWFDNPDEAAIFTQGVISSGDLVLVKGSQGMRMEKVVESILAYPERAPVLLCRQSDDWKKREWVQA